MHLTLHGEYSLRVLIYLAAHPGRYVSTQEISDAYGVSHHHLVKVVHGLGKRGFLAVKRGRSGGITLGRDPDRIRIGDVVRAMEPQFHLAECFDTETNTCPIVPVCGLKPVFVGALKAFLAELDRHTLADVMGARSRRAYAAYLSGNGNARSKDNPAA